LNHEREAVVMALLAVTATEDRDTQVPHSPVRCNQDIL